MICLKFWKNIKIGTMDSVRHGLTDFCLICLSPGYHFNIQDINHFYIHKDCFTHREYLGGGVRGDMILDFKDADDVYEKNKDNIYTVISLRKRYKTYIKKRNSGSGNDK